MPQYTLTNPIHKISYSSNFHNFMPVVTKFTQLYLGCTSIMFKWSEVSGCIMSEYNQCFKMLNASNLHKFQFYNLGNVSRRCTIPENLYLACGIMALSVIVLKILEIEIFEWP